MYRRRVLLLVRGRVPPLSTRLPPTGALFQGTPLRCIANPHTGVETPLLLRLDTLGSLEKAFFTAIVRREEHRLRFCAGDCGVKRATLRALRKHHPRLCSGTAEAESLPRRPASSDVSRGTEGEEKQGKNGKCNTRMTWPSFHLTCPQLFQFGLLLCLFVDDRTLWHRIREARKRILLKTNRRDGEDKANLMLNCTPIPFFLTQVLIWTSRFDDMPLEPRWDMNEGPCTAFPPFRLGPFTETSFSKYSVVQEGNKACGRALFFNIDAHDI